MSKSEDKVLKILNELGVVGNVSAEDYGVFEDYFTQRPLSDESSDNELEDEHSEDESLNLCDSSLLKDIPKFDDTLGSFENLIDLDNVIIEIEQGDSNDQVVDDDDGGENVVATDNCTDIVDTFNPNEDLDVILKFLENGCGCKDACSGKFSSDEYAQMRQDCAELDHYNNDHVNSLDQLILGQLRCLTIDTPFTVRSKKPKTERKQSRTKYLIKGIQVCKETYMFSNNIKIKRMKRLTKMYNESGLISKVHGNAGKVPKNVTSFCDTENIVRFLYNYAEQHAVILPGRSSTIYKTNLKLLPSSDTKVKIYETYKASFTPDMPSKPVSCRLFRNIWRQLCPEVVVMKPRSDLCATCQKHFTSGAAMALLPEETKLQTIEKMRSHLDLVSKERKFYKDTIKQSKTNFETEKTCVHYSFDMAQQIHIPSNPLQPGPIYFLVPFKIGIFGVMCDTVNKQMNFLIPESVSITKGSNLIVSLFHYYLEHHSHGEDTMFIHADNCVGQNKNNILLGYLCWRVCKGMNKEIVLSFMPVGHTKFSCDWAFGLLKKKFRVSHVSCIEEVVGCIEKSTPVTKVNQAVSLGNEEGEVKIEVHDWLNFFKDNGAKKVPQITHYNHFQFSATKNARVTCKVDVDGNEFVHRIFAEDSGPTGLPKVINPEGMSRQRKEYLYKNIRNFCKDEFKDTLCPAVPAAVEPDEPTEQPEVEDPEPAVKQTKKKRKRTL